MRRLFTALFLALGAGCGPQAVRAVEIDITQGQIQPMPVAIAPLRSDSYRRINFSGVSFPRITFGST